MSIDTPEHAIVDEDDEDEVEVKLKDGYISGAASDVDEEETADEIIMKELDRRGAKEGYVPFLPPGDILPIVAID